jgi:glycosyltransferase involved in cell wall biosynthesis
MKTSCLVNNYNYAPYVVQAIDSALDQTVPFDEIIVVDDGSTDGSLDLLWQRYGGDSRVVLISKTNEGQVSCLNEGFRASSGDLVFFLDADDLYEPQYLEQALRAYEHPDHCDCLLAAHRKYDGSPLRPLADSQRCVDLGYSVVLTLFAREWVGAPTSCLSMRRGLLSSILPVPYLVDWRLRADDCLVFGSSLAGGRKFRLESPLVRYRVHGGNRFAGRPYDKFDDYRRKLAVNRLFALMTTRLGYDVPRLRDFAHREFRTVQRPTLRQLRQYAGIALGAKASLPRKAGMLLSMAKYVAWDCRRRRGHALQVPLAPRRTATSRVSSPADSRAVQSAA